MITIEPLKTSNRNEHRKRALLYSELAELNRDVSDLRTFYLREAFAGYRNLQKSGKTEKQDLLNMSRILAWTRHALASGQNNLR